MAQLLFDSNRRGLKGLFRKLRSPDLSPTSDSPSGPSSPRTSSIVSRTGSSSSLASIGISTKSYGKKIDTIGHGVSAKVELYHHKQTNMLYAIKTFNPKESYETRDEYKARCSHEFNVVYGLNHVNVLKMYDFIPGFHTIQIVMEFAPYSLLKVIQMVKPSEEEITCFFRQVCEGVLFLHKNNVAHRDLKMENIVVDETATLKLIDFGTAFYFGKEKKLATGNVGTEALVSPEALSSIRYDAEANDVWGLAVLLYSMLNLSFPWKVARESDPEFKAFLLDKDILKDKYPESLWDATTNVLEVDPTKRLTMTQLQTVMGQKTPRHTECGVKIHQRTIRICMKKVQDVCL
ncbi:CYFA0S07e02784g1_1 [Cyberlindnera fabianii]|uniref:CYFA0S07e02784g1_1 n=1 Tax=Cyberlindnera fabianii TaxID=36022 RepID=A0A061AWD9_CYBFA|nr:CYFA0S07e02784g1_1 [Cyberlindnera fabianii]